MSRSSEASPSASAPRRVARRKRATESVDRACAYVATWAERVDHVLGGKAVPCGDPRGANAQFHAIPATAATATVTSSTDGGQGIALARQPWPSDSADGAVGVAQRLVTLGVPEPPTVRVGVSAHVRV